MKKLFLLDGHALIYRAHFAFITRPLMNSKGWNVSAIQGFMSNLWDMVLVNGPTHLAVVFDPPISTTFRHERYEQYKAGRDAQPEDIGLAIPWVHRICEAMRIPVLVVDNYEADDVIGTLAKQAGREGFQVYMVTPDKDFGQLVERSIQLFRPGRMGSETEIWGIKEVCDRWGINRVEQVTDILALMGDAVDNIPGVPGIGEKTAAKLLKEYDTVENLLENAEKLTGKMGDIIRTHAESARLSKWLATIDINVPIQFDDRQFEIEPFDREALVEIFKELEFRSLANKILNHPLASPPAPPPVEEASRKSRAGNTAQGNLFDGTEDAEAQPAPRSTDSLTDGNGESHDGMADRNIHNTPHTYHLVDTPEARKDLVKLLRQSKAVCYDSETTSLDANQADLVGLAFAVEAHEAYYVPVPPGRTEAVMVVEEFREIFENPSIEKIGQNLKYDVIVLKQYGIDLCEPLFDTMLAHYLLEPELRHNMNYLSETYLRYAPVKIESLIGKKGAGQLNMSEVDVRAVADYAAEDADITLQLHDFLRPKLEAHSEALVKLFREVENPLLLVLADIESAGVRIDPEFLKEYSVELTAIIRALETKIIEDAGFSFNVGSPKQVGEALFDRMKIPYPGRKMKSGQYSTDEATLAELAGTHPLAAEILKHRGLQKLKSTYIDALPALINPRTGRVHSSFNQALAATGRLSSQNPNLQNIPIRTPEGRRIREAFIPRDADHILLSADYSQIELRLIAEISGDQAMIEAFQKGHDIHQATASRVYDVPMEQVTAEQRRAAKTVNFLITYGGGATNLAGQLGIKRAEAKVLIETYFSEYTGLKNYMERMVDFARKHGYVETLLGRRRYVRDIDSKNNVMRAASERIAINTPIQGTAADMIKIAMVNIHRAMKEQGLQSKMILQVHDELVFDARRDELERLTPLVVELMRTALPDLKVPILVETGTGENWLEAH
jgi:DNA polymerase-1